jgi:hypothetical protein
MDGVLVTVMKARALFDDRPVKGTLAPWGTGQKANGGRLWQGSAQSHSTRQMR